MQLTMSVHVSILYGNMSQKATLFLWLVMEGPGTKVFWERLGVTSQTDPVRQAIVSRYSTASKSAFLPVILSMTCRSLSTT